MTERFDVVIVGGGLVGMSLAAALDGSALRVLQIEAQVPASQTEHWDERHFALGRASVARLRALDAWPRTSTDTPIREVHVSRAGAFGRVLLRAAEKGLDAFGATVPARQLVDALEQRLARCRSVQRWRPARLLDFTAHADRIELQIDADGEARVVCAGLLVAADGTESPIRKRLGIAEQRIDYAQTALVASVETERAHQGRAYERFGDDGPFALLPLSGHRAGVVCTLRDADAEAALQLADTDYRDLLQRRFGHRLGRFTRIGRRQPWPLRSMIAERLVDRRVALIGNAAQTIHPIGAQGFNLGLRDAGALAELLIAADDAGAAPLLERYAAARADDRARTIAVGDAVLRLGSAHGPLLQAAQVLMLAMIDRVPSLSGALARAAMGYRAVAS